MDHRVPDVSRGRGEIESVHTSAGSAETGADSVPSLQAADPPLAARQRLRHSQGRIVNALSIRERPAEVEDRAVPGHWEVDPLRGAGNTHVVTLVRKQKTDDRDALHILDLLMQNRFPRIWVPSAAERDVRQLVRHRHKLVRLRTSVMNQLHALAMGFACRAARQVSW